MENRNRTLRSLVSVSFIYPVEGAGQQIIGIFVSWGTLSEGLYVNAKNTGVKFAAAAVTAMMNLLFEDCKDADHPVSHFIGITELNGHSLGAFVAGKVAEGLMSIHEGHRVKRLLGLDAAGFDLTFEVGVFWRREWAQLTVLLVTSVDGFGTQIVGMAHLTIHVNGGRIYPRNPSSLWFSAKNILTEGDNHSYVVYLYVEIAGKLKDPNATLRLFYSPTPNKSFHPKDCVSQRTSDKACYMVESNLRTIPSQNVSMYALYLIYSVFEKNGHRFDIPSETYEVPTYTEESYPTNDPINANDWKKVVYSPEPRPRQFKL